MDEGALRELLAGVRAGELHPDDAVRELRRRRSGLGLPGWITPPRSSLGGVVRAVEGHPTVPSRGGTLAAGPELGVLTRSEP